MYYEYSRWANTSPQEHYVKSAVLDLNWAPLWQQEGLSVYIETQSVAPRVGDLGLTQRQAAEVRANLSSFEEDWGAPGMEGYDGL